MYLFAFVFVCYSIFNWNQFAEVEEKKKKKKKGKKSEKFMKRTTIKMNGRSLSFVRNVHSRNLTRNQAVWCESFFSLALSNSTFFLLFTFCFSFYCFGENITNNNSNNTKKDKTPWSKWNKCAVCDVWRKRTKSALLQ